MSRSSALTTMSILVTLSAAALFIVAAIVDPSASLIADDGGPRSTASIAAAPLPKRVLIPPAKPVPTIQTNATRSAELRQAVLGAHGHSNPAVAASSRLVAELTNVTEVFRAELRNGEAGRDPDVDALAEQTGSASSDVQLETSYLSVKPKPKPTVLAVKEPSPPTRSARVRRDVRMRARPRNGAAVVMAVRGGSEVEVVSCRTWCEVALNGKRGWIYKKFIQGAGS